MLALADAATAPNDEKGNTPWGYKPQPRVGRRNTAFSHFPSPSLYGWGISYFIFHTSYFILHISYFILHTSVDFCKRSNTSSFGILAPHSSSLHRAIPCGHYSCCLNRPFDDQTQSRIALETQAIMTILSQCQSGIWRLKQVDEQR